MKLLCDDSLAATLDAVNELLFTGQTLPATEKKAVSRWLAGRQGLPGSYAEMFAPTAEDIQQGVRLFTGERITSGAALGM